MKPARGKRPSVSSPAAQEERISDTPLFVTFDCLRSPLGKQISTTSSLPRAPAFSPMNIQVVSHDGGLRTLDPALHFRRGAFPDYDYVIV